MDTLNLEGSSRPLDKKLKVMKRSLTYILVVLLLVLSQKVSAQDQTVYSNYISNQGILNPAYNGTRDVVSALAIFRSQWTGFKGAPITGALNVHAPIDGVKDLGVGGVFTFDKIGITKSIEFFGAASYKLHIDRKNTIALGLQFGFINFSYDGADTYTVDYGDPLFSSKVSKFGFNAGVGAYYYTDTYFAGFSIPRFFANKYDTDKQELKNTVVMKDLHMYLYGGCVFDVDDIKIKPTALIRIVPGAPLQVDLQVNFLLMNQLWLGLAYRTVSDLVFLAEYQITRQLAIRYCFDYAFDSIMKYAKAGSHEIGVQYDFSLKRRPGMRSIRYF